MALRIRYQYATGRQLGYSIERLSDGTRFDTSDKSFKILPVSPISSLPEAGSPFLGLYQANVDSSAFHNGDYAVAIHDTISTQVISLLPSLIVSGDDSTIIPNSSTILDPWGTVLPGNYGQGTAGFILGQNLDARISSRSVFAGGSVQSVISPVTVGVNNDKAGYSLDSKGLENIIVETGVNLRQALSPILAASAGVLTGAGTGTILIRGGNVPTTRITATTDNAGNRTSVTLSLPS